MDKPPKAKAVNEKRDYPKWTPAMTTADYLQATLRLLKGNRETKSA
jgi:hypothetical protein